MALSCLMLVFKKPVLLDGPDPEVAEVGGPEVDEAAEVGSADEDVHDGPNCFGVPWGPSINR